MKTAFDATNPIHSTLQALSSHVDSLKGKERGIIVAVSETHIFVTRTVDGREMASKYQYTVDEERCLVITRGSVREYARRQPKLVGHTQASHRAEPVDEAEESVPEQTCQVAPGSGMKPSGLLVRMLMRAGVVEPPKLRSFKEVMGGHS